jgi:hypothetical protein
MEELRVNGMKRLYEKCKLILHHLHFKRGICMVELFSLNQ